MLDPGPVFMCSCVCLSPRSGPACLSEEEEDVEEASTEEEALTGAEEAEEEEASEGEEEASTGSRTSDLRRGWSVSPPR